MRNRRQATSIETRRRTRRSLAFAAARLMAEQGIDDPFVARRKALAALLEAPQGSDLPDAREILDCLRERRALLRPEAHLATVRRLRGAALEAMTLFAPFGPRLVGPVLDGSAGEDTALTLHLLGAYVEEVALFLIDRGTRYHAAEVQVRFSGREASSLPALHLDGPAYSLLLVVFSPEMPQHSPQDPLTGRAMARATRVQVEALLRSEVDRSEIGS